MGAIFPSQLACELKMKVMEDSQYHVCPKSYNIGCLQMGAAEIVGKSLFTEKLKGYQKRGYSMVTAGSFTSLN